MTPLDDDLAIIAELGAAIRAHNWPEAAALWGRLAHWHAELIARNPQLGAVGPILQRESARVYEHSHSVH